MQRIIYAGDSTVTFNKIGDYPQAGLSQGLPLYLKDDVFVWSFAVNGRSTKSFLDEGRLQKVEEILAKDDLFLIQFGHNDEKQQDPARYAAAFGAYQENLKIMIDAARKHEAKPVLITSLARRLFDEGGCFLGGSHGDYPEAMRQLAEREGVPCIDLNRESEAYLKAVGDFASRPMYVYPKDNSHLTYHGAVIFAGMIAEGLRGLGAPYDLVLLPLQEKKTASEKDALTKRLDAAHAGEQSESGEKQ